MVDQFTPDLASRSGLWESVATGLRRAIITGELGPGVHLQEPVLAQKFRVSRIPVREALRQLGHEGLVRSESRRGAFVIGFTAADVQEVYDLRRLIELPAARLAAGSATPQNLDRLTALVDTMARAVDAGQPQRIAEPDVAFHRGLIEASMHRRLLAAWEPLAGIVLTLLEITNTANQDLPASIDSHQRMVQALANRDPDQIEAILYEHLRSGEQVMLKAMKDLAVSQPV